MELTDDPSFLDKRLERSFRGTRIAWMGDFDGYLATDPGLLTVCEKSFKTFASIGVEVEPVSPEFDMPSLWDTWLKWRGLAQVGRYELWKDPAKRRLMKPEANWEVEMALKYTALDISRADGQRTDWYAAVMKIFRRVRLHPRPEHPGVPFDKNINWPKSSTAAAWTPTTGGWRP
jgi:ureidomalonase